MRCSLTWCFIARNAGWCMVIIFQHCGFSMWTRGNEDVWFTRNSREENSPIGIIIKHTRVNFQSRHNAFLEAASPLTFTPTHRVLAPHMLSRNTNSLPSPAAYAMTEHMWQIAYVVKCRPKGPHQFFARSLARCFLAFQAVFGAVVGWRYGNQSSMLGQYMAWQRQAVVERGSLGGSSSDTLLVLASCNSAWKVWPGRHSRGTWERWGLWVEGQRQRIQHNNLRRGKE